MSASVPARIGPYPIERELGRGGMGIVYLGRDEALGRPVAVKVLPAAVADDRERLARFEREARLLAAVHHPNVASIFAVGGGDSSAGSTPGAERYLALEYVAGESLQQRLVAGPLSVREAIEVCRQIAAGLEAAHEAGVVHRDLKPGNVRITPDGVAKVLDFGLAKAGGGASGSGIGSNPEDATRTFGATEEGIVLGTLPYMSPEQARGGAVDRRTDIWALGCVLFECLSGRPPFGGPSATDLVAGIVLRDPPWEQLPAATPLRLRELLVRCLEKDRNRRLRDAGDLRLELEAIAADRSAVSNASGIAGPAAVPTPGRRAVWVMGALLLAAACAAAGWLARRSPAADYGGRRLSIALPSDMQVDFLAISRRGDGILVLGRPRGAPLSEERLYRRAPDSFEPQPIAGTERSKVGYFAPDGSVRFLAAQATAENELWMFSVPFDGSAPPTPLYRWDPTWRLVRTLPDGDDLVLSSQLQSFAVMPRGSRQPGAMRRIDVGFPARFNFLGFALGDGRWVLMTFMRTTERGFSQGTAAIEVATGKGHVVLEDGWAQALHGDTLLFSRGATLFGVPFDSATHRVRGPEVALASGLRVFFSGLSGEFVLADDGALTFVHGGDAAADRQLVACTPGGACEPWLPLRRRFVEGSELSASGDEVAAVISGRNGNFEIWAFAKSGTARPLVSRPGHDLTTPAWSADGSRLAFFDSHANDDEEGLYVSGLDGKPPRQLVSVATGRRDWPIAWLTGGELLLRHRGREGGTSDLSILDLAGAGPPRDLLATDLEERPIAASPTHPHIAFVSDASGQEEAFLAELLPGGRLGPAVPLSLGRAIAGSFSRDGRSFFYYDGDPNDGLTANASIRRVRLDDAGKPTGATPDTVVDLGREQVFPDFTVLPDGRLLFIGKGRGEEQVSRLDVILGFADEVERRMEARK